MSDISRCIRRHRAVSPWVPVAARARAAGAVVVRLILAVPLAAYWLLFTVRGLAVSLVAVPLLGATLLWACGAPEPDPLVPGPARMTGYSDTAPCRRVSGGVCTPAADRVYMPATGPLDVPRGR